MDTSPLPVVHLVDAAGGTGQLWGKERVVLWIMEAQRRAGRVNPRLITLSPSLLHDRAAELGLASTHLTMAPSKNPLAYVSAIRTALAELTHNTDEPPPVIHTHGYKANLLGRACRLCRLPMSALISTCHGWVETTRSLRLYNALDRWSSRYSDSVTVPSPLMQTRLPRAIFVPNGIPNADSASPHRRLEIRAKLGFDDRAILVGTLGRLSPEKGIDTWINAAKRLKDCPNIYWLMAGEGPLEAEVRRASSEFPNVRFIGYVPSADELLPTLDIFLQPSWSEGLSLALLEASREGLAIVATRVGATAWAVRHEHEAILADAGDDATLAQAVESLAHDSSRRATLGRAARVRFEEALTVDAMEKTMADLYARHRHVRPPIGN